MDEHTTTNLELSMERGLGGFLLTFLDALGWDGAVRFFRKAGSSRCGDTVHTTG